MVARDVMETHLCVASPDDRLADIARILDEHPHSMLPVVDENGRLVGVLSELDLLGFVLPASVEDVDSLRFLPESYRLRDLGQEELRDVRVGEVMQTENLLTVSEDEPIGQVALMMVKGRRSHIMVVTEGELVGQVNREALVRELVHPSLGVGDSL